MVIPFGRMECAKAKRQESGLIVQLLSPEGLEGEPCGRERQAAGVGKQAAALTQRALTATPDPYPSKIIKKAMCPWPSFLGLYFSFKQTPHLFLALLCLMHWYSSSPLTKHAVRKLSEMYLHDSTWGPCLLVRNHEIELRIGWGLRVWVGPVAYSTS